MESDDLESDNFELDSTVDDQPDGKMQELEALVASMQIDLDHVRQEKTNLIEENIKISQNQTNVCEGYNDIDL